MSIPLIVQTAQMAHNKDFQFLRINYASTKMLYQSELLHLFLVNGTFSLLPLKCVEASIHSLN